MIVYCVRDDGEVKEMYLAETYATLEEAEARRVVVLNKKIEAKILEVSSLQEKISAIELSRQEVAIG